MKKILWMLVAFVMLFTSAVVCYAEDETVTIPEEEHNQIVAEMQQTVDKQSEEIQALIDENKTTQSHLEQLYSLYSTWTAVMGLLFVLFGIVLPIVLPFIISHKNNVKVNQLKKQLINEIDVQREKSLIINNAIALATSGDFWTACELIKNMQVLYPDEAYLKVYLANYTFRLLDKQMHPSGGFEDPDVEIVKAHCDEIINGIENYVEVSKCGDAFAKLMVGNIFPQSFIHEMFFMINWLSLLQNTLSYHKVVQYYNDLLHIIEVELKITNKEDLFNIDQTNVYIMIYKQICAKIAKIYCENDHCKAKETLEWTIQLLNIDDFSKSDLLLRECECLLSEYINK